jgi:hypothetical protein
MSGVFAAHQPIYAHYGIATFPVRGDKSPAVTNYNRMGIPAGRKLASREQFRGLNGIAYMTNARTKVAVLDVDTTDENVLADALGRHGMTPMIERTASGKFHALYRFNGEYRKIRPWGDDLPIDLLGQGGLVVVHPSKFEAGEYSLARGHLDDLDRLPVMQGLDPAMYAPRETKIEMPGADLLASAGFESGDDGVVYEGNRHDDLLRFCMKQRLDDLNTTIDAARTRNATFIPPMSDTEVIQVASWAWEKTIRGENRFGQHGSYLRTETVNELVSDPYLMALISWLQAHNKPDARFLVANGLADVLGWPRRQFADARTKAIESGWIVPLNRPSPGIAVSYRWGSK